MVKSILVAATNVALLNEPAPDWGAREARKLIEAVCANLGISLDPSAPVDDGNGEVEEAEGNVGKQIAPGPARKPRLPPPSRAASGRPFALGKEKGPAFARRAMWRPFMRPRRASGLEERGADPEARREANLMDHNRERAILMARTLAELICAGGRRPYPKKEGVHESVLIVRGFSSDWRKKRQ